MQDNNTQDYNSQNDIRKEWKCGKCGKTYTFDEFLKLIKGNIYICECGYRFLLDRWRLQDRIKLKINDDEREILVSSVDLEINHGFRKDLWYETMIFVQEEENKDKIECNFEHRYATKEEAIDDHNRILNLLKKGKYKIKKVDHTKELIIETINQFK